MMMRRWITVTSWHGPLARYVKLQVAHAPGMPGTFSPPLWVSDPDVHHGTCVTHVTWCISGVLWIRWRGKPSRHSRRMRNAQFYVSGKRSMETLSSLLALCEVVTGLITKGQLCGVLVFPFSLAWRTYWTNNRFAGHLRRHEARVASL